MAYVVDMSLSLTATSPRYHRKFVRQENCVHGIRSDQLIQLQQIML